MSKLNEEQKELFKCLRLIQERIVVIGLSKYDKNNSVEDLLYDVSYEAIYGVMELIDGYSTDSIKMDLIDKETGVSLRGNIELHDICADYLHCSN